MAYIAPREKSVILSEIVSRLAAAILLSLGAALDIAVHTLCVLPTLLYCVGKSIYQQKADFNLPWEHIQRVRNAVAPLVLGSVFGLIHPYAGLAMSEPTDKHILFGILTSNTKQERETPCSPIHSLAIAEDLAARNVKKDGVNQEVFPPECSKILKETKKIEKSLESLQAQEYIHKITNITLFVMAIINQSCERAKYGQVLLRLSGVLIPILTAVDLAIAVIAQAFFLVTGVVRLISGRGPIYTEVTKNPLMHVSFLIQSILKSVGNLIGTLVWFAVPMAGFKVSLLPANMFFKMQLGALQLMIKRKMQTGRENSKMVIPIVFGNGETSALSVPTHSMHKTYLIVEKKNNLFNLYWVNRPKVSLRQNLELKVAIDQIKSMFNERFPFMDLKKIINYPINSEEPKFLEAKEFDNIAGQGNSTNCVVSNLFGTIETLNKINGKNDETNKKLNKITREYLAKKYSFYRDNFLPFTDMSNFFSGSDVWYTASTFPEAAI